MLIDVHDMLKVKDLNVHAVISSLDEDYRVKVRAGKIWPEARLMAHPSVSAGSLYLVLKDKDARDARTNR